MPWHEKQMLESVFAAKRRYHGVFRLTERSTRSEWEEVFGRITKGEYSPGEQEGIEKLRRDDPEWVEDVIDKKGQPRSWIEIRERIEHDWKPVVTDELSKCVANLPPNPRRCSDADIIEDVLERITWRAISKSGAWLAKPDPTQAGNDELQDAVTRGVTRAAHPSKLFTDYCLLNQLCDEWETFYCKIYNTSPKMLMLKYTAAGSIRKARVSFTRDKLGQPVTYKPTNAEIRQHAGYTSHFFLWHIIAKSLKWADLENRRGTHAWPHSFKTLINTVLDENQCLDLHIWVRSYARQAIRDYIKKGNANGGSAPEEEEVITELKLLKGQRLLKNSRGYLETRLERTPDSWAPCVFTDGLYDANRAVEFAMNRRANYREAPVFVTLSNEGGKDTFIAGKSNLPSSKAPKKQKKNLWVRAALRGASPDEKKVVTLINDQTLDPEAFAAKHGWTLQEVQVLCEKVERRLRDYATKKGPPPGY